MKNIVFLISAIDFNSAPFNRFLTIVKAVGLSQHEYEVIDIRPSGTKISMNAIHLNSKTIEYEGIIIERTLKSTKKSKNIFIKIFRPTRERFFALRLFKRKIKKNSVVYLISGSNFDCLFYYILSKLFKYKYVHERSEYPMLVRNPKPIKTFYYNKMILPWCFKLFDGMVIMTDTLINFYSKFVRASCIICKIPMTVDTDRFSRKSERREKYIGYVGSFSSKKDGVDNLIKAFGLIKNEIDGYVLKIAGSSKNFEEKKHLTDLSIKYDLEDKLEFVGQKTREQIPDFLMKASLLVLARPESKQAEGGFPTKLGEYLSTGKPVIVTEVGEINHYLVNGKNAYFVKPGSVEDLSRKMKQVIHEYTVAETIGKEGKKVAINKFDYRIHVEKLGVFFEEL